MAGLSKEYADSSWDFRSADTKRDTHCYHNYPAMMIPRIANRILDCYGETIKMLFDPYCGTGTSLVEATTMNKIVYKEANSTATVSQNN